MSSRWGEFLFELLAEPVTRGMCVDDPAMTVRRRELSKTKRGLHLSYLAWYRELEEIHSLAPAGARIELGSGGGFMDEHIPGLIKTDVLLLPHLDVLCRAESLPFSDASIGAIFMVNVLHHMNEAGRFLAEVSRVLRPGGYVAMVEPFTTPFSRFLYGHLHPEPFEPGATEWDLEPSGPLSGGNGALPWIIFVRDRELFHARFPHLRILKVRPHTALTHLFSGGVMIRSLLPGLFFPTIHRIESALGPLWMRKMALFATIVLQREG